jgi:hypothetical protein
MRGHDAIIAMRQRGKKPALVFLDLCRDFSPAPMWRDWPEVQPAIATVWVQDSDVPSRLDLRFLVGLNAVISGRDSERIEQLERAAIEAGAARAIAVTLTLDERRQEHRVVRVTDSAGAINDQPTETTHGSDAAA